MWVVGLSRPPHRTRAPEGSGEPTTLPPGGPGYESGCGDARDVAKSYARCLYRETDGRVEVLVEHLEDGDYRPVGPEAEALAACSDKLNAGD